MSRQCNHRKCRAAGGPCRSLTRAELFPDPEPFDTRLAEALIDAGWRQTSRRYRCVAACGAKNYGVDQLGTLELSRPQFNEFRRLGGTTHCRRCRGHCTGTDLRLEDLAAVVGIIGREPRALDIDEQGRPFIWSPPVDPNRVID